MRACDCSYMANNLTIIKLIIYIKYHHFLDCALITMGSTGQRLSRKQALGHDAFAAPKHGELQRWESEKKWMYVHTCT